MTATSLNFKRFSGTRNMLIELLRRKSYKVEELAGELGITKNAVRSQIALLERDGIIKAAGEIKGKRRPAATYGLSPEADLYFSKAYPDALAHLIRLLSERMSGKEFRRVMKDLGKRIADFLPHPAGDLRKRVEAAVKTYESLGAMAEIAEEGGKIVIKGHGCPFSRAVKADERFCTVVESILSKMIGVPVVERCDRSERPSCRFEVISKKNKNQKSLDQTFYFSEKPKYCKI